jgi:hypothetical protein
MSSPSSPPQAKKILCSSCEYKYNVPSSDTGNLWGFYPYSHVTYQSMKEALSEYISAHYNYNNIPKNPSFYNTYNEDGYTYTQWYVYYLSKNVYKFRKLYRPTMWMFRILAEYPFFNALIRQGKRDDPSHTTLHHFMKYLEKYGGIQKEMVGLLQYHGLNMEDEDSEGFTGHSYLLHLEMSDEDQKEATLLTHEYKKMEDDLFKSITSYLRTCHDCGEPIAKYEDLSYYFNVNYKDVKNDILSKIECILKKRQECNNIYRKYIENNENNDNKENNENNENNENKNKDKENQNIQRHQYVIDQYKKIIWNNVISE